MLKFELPSDCAARIRMRPLALYLSGATDREVGVMLTL